MATVWKDILYAGNWKLRDGRTFRCTPADLVHFKSRMREMIASGLPVPLSWEHQPSVKPGNPDHDRAERTKLCLGHASAVKSDEGPLETRLEIPNADDAAKLPAVRFVSPYIEYDFVDGSGRKWDGPSITHIAVTPRPIQHTQKPFAMSHDGGCQAVEPVTVAGKKYAPGQFIPQTAIRQLPISLSLADYEGAMADDKKKMPDDEGDDDAKGKVDVDVDGDGKADVSGTPVAPNIADVVSKLAEHKIVLGDDTTMDNFFDRLVAALGTKSAHDGTGSEDELAGATEAGPQGMGGGAGIAMSLEKMTARAERAEAKLLEVEQKTLVRRVKGLKHIPKPVRDNLLAEVTAVSLSLGDDAEVKPNAVLAKVEAFESLAGHSSFTPVALSAAEEVDLPKESRKKGEGDRKAQEEAGDELARLAGCSPKE